MKRLLLLLCLFPTMLTAQRVGDDGPPDRGDRPVPPRIEELRQRMRAHRDAMMPPDAPRAQQQEEEGGPATEPGRERRLNRPGRMLPPGRPPFDADSPPRRGTPGRGDGQRPQGGPGAGDDLPPAARLLRARLRLMELRIQLLERRLHGGEQDRRAGRQQPPRDQGPRRPRGPRQQRQQPMPAADERA
jgi:hypothetical protein